MNWVPILTIPLAFILLFSSFTLAYPVSFSDISQDIPFKADGWGYTGATTVGTANEIIEIDPLSNECHTMKDKEKCESNGCYWWCFKYMDHYCTCDHRPEPDQWVFTDVSLHVTGAVRTVGYIVGKEWWPDPYIGYLEMGEIRSYKSDPLNKMRFKVIDFDGNILFDDVCKECQIAFWGSYGYYYWDYDPNYPFGDPGEVEVHCTVIGEKEDLYNQIYFAIWEYKNESIERVCSQTTQVVSSSVPTYELTSREDCKEGFVGAMKEVVDDEFCG